MHTEQKWLPLLSRAAACGLTGVVLTLMLSWLAAFAVNRELLPEVDTQLIALICCAIACLITGAFSPQPEKGRALGGAMTWAVDDRLSDSESICRCAAFLRRNRRHTRGRTCGVDYRFVHFS